MYASQDDWVHVNCALWSAEVFEEVDGTLQHVHVAAKRGKHMVGGITVSACWSSAVQVYLCTEDENVCV